MTKPPTERLPDDPILRRVELCRRAKGITVPELAKRAYISMYTYYHWIEGKTSPKLCHLRDVMRVLGMELIIRVKSEEWSKRYDAT